MRTGLSPREVVVPDRATAIEGWRAWRIREGKTLCATAHSVPWKPGEPVQAQCFRSVGMWQVVTYIASVDWSGKPPKARAEEVIEEEKPPEHPAHVGSAPQTDCNCGIYATKSLKALLKAWNLNFDDGQVYGRVALWGKVVEHESGYRAEFAYPLEIRVPGSLSKYASALQAYGVPVIVTDEVPRMRKMEKIKSKVIQSSIGAAAILVGLGLASGIYYLMSNPATSRLTTIGLIILTVALSSYPLGGFVKRLYLHRQDDD